MQVRLLALVVLALLASCRHAPRSGLDFEEAWPDELSAWRVFERQGNRLILNRGAVPYEVNSALFSDYAHKLRSIFVPPGTAIRYGADAFEFPIGTVISKTFYYPLAERSQSSAATAVAKQLGPNKAATLDLDRVRVLETRLLVKTRSGWVALPYVWNDAQTEAAFEPAGEAFELELVAGDTRTPFTYLVPDAHQCASCHAADYRQQRLEPIGIKARHLNRDYPYASGVENQLTHWRRIGLLTNSPDPERAPRLARWEAEGESLNTRARAYLDINCGHCHSANAAANSSALRLDVHESESVHLGICKIPVASGRGSGLGAFDIVPGAPEQSILLHRMRSTEPDVAMPELGRSLVHEEAVSLIEEWIAALPGSCDPA